MSRILKPFPTEHNGLDAGFPVEYKNPVFDKNFHFQNLIKNEEFLFVYFIFPTLLYPLRHPLKEQLQNSDLDYTSSFLQASLYSSSMNYILHLWINLLL